MISLDSNLLANLIRRSRKREGKPGRREASGQIEKLKSGQWRNSALRRYARKNPLRNDIDTEIVRAGEALQSMKSRDQEDVQSAPSLAKLARRG
ncbi:hypothetical protein GQ43DRAFT_306488 [Delitschia confertaspora ATCC 74209]|uniref:Uncharacterized protein n=1 Tax=Delitschia confertaspora ATCC 74209 TaxID=1513339 RepID=A0A9P4JNZ8_9PLEO|nr:hypothetical protein GQ43DRAFT_306488 [Delitschia confertaspora ATCC 74209]